MTDVGDDPAFADLLDDLLTQALEGREPDLAAAAARHAEVAARIPEAMELVAAAAGRRHRQRPSLHGYEVLREIGRGGMGTVWLARNATLDREVALKVLPHSFGLSLHSRQRFLAEARALARVRHDHVINVHRVLDDGDVLAFEMEYVDGPSLQQVLDHLRAVLRDKATPRLEHVAEVLRLDVAALGARNLTQFFVRLALKLARALGAVHDSGLIHRDVKPANVLLRRDGEPVLVDFGLARIVNAGASRTGGFSGTPVYSAPEQLRGDPELGPPADVYGLAVTLYECLTLTSPVAGRSTTDQLRRIEDGRTVPLRQNAPDVPRDLATIVAHAMELDPAHRYRDGSALADDLQRLLDLQPVLARPAGLARRVGKFVRRQRASLLAACIGALLVALAMIPLVGSAEAARGRRELAREHWHAAQQHLVAVHRRSLPRRIGDPSTPVPRASTSLRAVTAPLSDALAEYDRSLELDPDNGDAVRERAIVRLTLWLRELSIPDLDSLQRHLGGETFRSLTAGLGPVTRRAARDLVTGTVPADAAREIAAEASPEDRMDVGLLYFLLADVGKCEDAWQPLGPAQRDQPLVSAALGLIHLADGMPDLAYVELLRAQRDFPDSSTLRLALADAAVSLGDPWQARRWLGDSAGTPASVLVRRRLELDLAATTLPETELRDGYRALADADPSDPTPRHRLAMLSLRAGDANRAIVELDRLLTDWPDEAKFRLDRARLSLLQRDLRGYAQQALAVLRHDFGRDHSRGTTADLLEILRIGGLTRLWRDGIEKTGNRRTGRSSFGGETPIHVFAPGIAPWFEDLLETAVGVERSSRSIAERLGLGNDAASVAVLTLPFLAGRLPLLTASKDVPLRAALLTVPPFVAQQYARVAPALRMLPAWFGGRWGRIDLRSVPRPDDLPGQVLFGWTLLRVDDTNGDSIDDLLVGCSSHLPEDNLMLVVDGRTGGVIARLASDSDEHLFAHSSAVVGDLDGDGRADWLFGSPAGTGATAAGMAEAWSSKTHRMLFRIEGTGPGFGVAVAALGDVDGDGTADFAVATAPMLRNTAAQGSVEIFSGRSRAVLHTLVNDVPGVWFGASIAPCSDADRDGVDDLVVGGNFGGAPGLVRLFSARTGALLREWSDASPASGFGTTVLGVGDANEDGVGDVAISAVRRDDPSGVDRVFVMSGADGRTLATISDDRPATGFGETLLLYPAAHGEPVLLIPAAEGGRLEFYSRRGARLSTVAAYSPGERFGSAVALGQDRDGDGADDLVVAARGPDARGSVHWIGSAQVRWPTRATTPR